jgi:ribosomal RNA assembly protein
MKTFFLDELKVLKKYKRKLQKELEVKITIEGNDVSIDGDADDEFFAEKIIIALNFGFPMDAALLIKREEFLFEILNIKDYTTKKDLKTIRARIIGSGGKTLRTLATLTECFFEIKENTVGIIGSPENIENAQNSIISIIRGSKQANVYSYLEKHRTQPVLDLGLKKGNKNL